MAAWLLALFTSVPAFTTAVVGVNHIVLQIRFIVENVVVLICLTAIVFLYIMVYLGVRKRKIKEVSQVNALIEAKLQSKVAKTTGLLTAALILSFLPAIGMASLGTISPVFETNSFFRLAEALVRLNSVISPILCTVTETDIFGKLCWNY